jgi:hypothetical protein
MKPFPGELCKGSPKRIFNYRLSRARRIVDNAFGILASVFRVFRKPLAVECNTAESIVLACIYLHNFLRRNSMSRNLYTPPGSFDVENIEDGMIIEGAWRQEVQAYTGICRFSRTLRRSGKEGTAIRDIFKNYFMNEGRVSWQDKYCSRLKLWPQGYIVGLGFCCSR